MASASLKLYTILSLEAHFGGKIVALLSILREPPMRSKTDGKQ